MKLFYQIPESKSINMRYGGIRSCLIDMGHKHADNNVMRYSSGEKEAVRKLRSEGLSLGAIFSQTSIPKTTIRSWIKDISLTNEQKAVIKRTALHALQTGRIRVQEANKKERIENVTALFEAGKADIGTLSERELFIAGIALYWAEGFKNRYEHRLGFCNSDPSMVKFYLYWLEKCLQVKKEDIVLRLTLNKAYQKDAKVIGEYWAQYLEIQKTQFTKPFYQNAIWKRKYKTDTYKGVVRVHVKNSLSYLLKMRGWIEGLRLNKAG